MIKLCNTCCCGEMEIDGLSHAKTPLDAFLYTADRLRQKHMYNEAPVFIVFTGVTVKREDAHARTDRTDNYGQAFADFLTKHKLGRIMASEERKSFSTNTIRLWVWHPAYDEVWRLLKEVEGV